MWKRLPTWAKWVLGVFGAILLVGVVNNLLGEGADGSSLVSAPPEPTRFASVREIGASSAVGKTFAVLVPEGAAPSQMEHWSRRLCEGESFCLVLGWSEAALMASAMPMADREASSLEFSYRLNRHTGLDAAVWNCDRWPGEPDSCAHGERME